jgi:hypothetical protein
MPAPGTTPPKKRVEPQVRPATGINPSTGEDIELPTWAAQASYYLRSRTTVTLIGTALLFFGAKIGFQPDEEETKQLVSSLDTIVVATGWFLALFFNIRRRWTPPTK